MKITHIYWFAYFNKSEPSVRYRGTYALELLCKEQGIPYSIVYPGYSLGTIIHFLIIYFSVLLFRKKDSVIVFQKIYTNGIYTQALRFLLFFRYKNTVYDIDDAEHTRHPVKHIHHFLRHCTYCTVGSQALIDYVKPFNTNVFLLTSPIIEHRYFRSASALKSPLTIGWIGYYGAHRSSLQTLFFPALADLDIRLKLVLLGLSSAEEKKDVEQTLKGNKNISIETPLEIDWLNEDAVYKYIAQFDIAVAPLLDTEFNRAKSAFKLKQCLSCAVPVLASGVGENLSFIAEGENGFICQNSNDFKQRIQEIVALPPDVYIEMQRHAKETFPSFSMEYYCKLFIKIFD